MTNEAEYQYHLEFDHVAALGGKHGWLVKEGDEVIARCTGEREANTVVDALNFAAQPHKYGYAIQTREIVTNAT